MDTGTFFKYLPAITNEPPLLGAADNASPLTPHPSPMGPRPRFRLVALIACAATLLLAACGEKPEQETALPDYPKLVKTVIFQQEGGVSLLGRVDAVDKVDLAFQVNGPLVELPVLEGQRVKKSDLLARIDPRDYDNVLAAAKAKLDEAQRQYERYAQLIKTRTSPVSQAEVDQKKADYEIARSVADQARKDLDDTYMRAPFNGQIAARYVDNY